jgi:PBP1b-binding outer membrane lipoprotein LpoB
MKRIALILSLAGFVFTSCNNETKTETTTTDTTSTDKTATTTDPPAPPMDSAAMTKAWQDFAKPGEMHKWMASHTGTWEADVSSYMGGPEPTKSKATEVVKMTMNGLYQIANMSGTMMNGPFQGQSTLAYDNSKKQFVMTWIDNMGSGIIMMTGQYDAATKTMNFKGTQTDPATGKDANIRQEQKFTDDDNYVLTMYGDGPDGKEAKFMEATFKRVKK